MVVLASLSYWGRLGACAHTASSILESLVETRFQAEAFIWGGGGVGGLKATSFTKVGSQHATTKIQ